MISPLISSKLNVWLAGKDVCPKNWIPLFVEINSKSPEKINPIVGFGAYIFKTGVKVKRRIIKTTINICFFLITGFFLKLCHLILY